MSRVEEPEARCALRRRLVVGGRMIRQALAALLPCLVLVACTSSTAEMAGTGQDEAVIRQIVQESEDALNARDFQAFVASYSDDADLVVFDSPRASGPTAARELMEEGWSNVPSDVRAELTVESIRFVTSDVAVVNIDGVFTGSRPSVDRATAIFVRRDGGWQVGALRVIPPEVGAVAAADGIADTWEAFESAWESGDLDTAMGFFASDGVNMPYFGVTQSGRGGITAGLAETMNRGTYDVRARNTIEVGRLGDTAYEFGTLDQTYTPDGGEAIPDRMRYVSIFRLEPDGVWRFHRWMAQHETENAS